MRVNQPRSSLIRSARRPRQPRPPPPLAAAGQARPVQHPMHWCWRNGGRANAAAEQSPFCATPLSTHAARLPARTRRPALRKPHLLLQHKRTQLRQLGEHKLRHLWATCALSSRYAQSRVRPLPPPPPSPCPPPLPCGGPAAAVEGASVRGSSCSCSCSYTRAKICSASASGTSMVPLKAPKTAPGGHPGSRPCSPVHARQRGAVQAAAMSHPPRAGIGIGIGGRAGHSAGLGPVRQRRWRWPWR